MLQPVSQTWGLCEDFSKGPPETEHTHINFIIVYCYNCSFLLVIVVNILLLLNV